MTGKHPLQQTSILIGLAACGLIASAELHALVHSQSLFGTPAGAAEKKQSPGDPGGAASSVSKGGSIAKDTTVTLNKRKFDLAKSDDLNAFVQAVRELRALSKEEKEDSEQAKQEGKKSEEKRDWSRKKVRHGLKAMEHLAQALQKGKGENDDAIQQIQEIAWAVESNFVIPYFWRPRLDFGDVFFQTRNMTLNACGRGSRENPAMNLLTYNVPDLSRVDPAPSTFWMPPGSIASKNLYTGFDREALPEFSSSVCTYDSPHSGYGIHPSFEVIQHDRHWKVKFDEEHSSGPFASRLFWALGFPVEIADYTPEVKVRWDRRILSQFNSRKLNRMELKLFGLPIATTHPNRYFDPFAYIKYAVLTDGSHIETDALRKRLFARSSGRSIPRHPEQRLDLYDAAFEKTIDYLVMKEASFTSKESENSQEIGCWDYNSLGHPKRREVRAMAVLNAWLDNWDVRWGNTRLNLVEAKDGTYRLEHRVSDPGALFGNSSGMVRPVHNRLKIGLYQDAPNDYGWTFTHTQSPEKWTVPIRDYMTDSKIRPFYEMNLDDARWMARLIAQLTEEQIKAALIAAGYDAAEGRFLLEKLVARRDQMIQDFGQSDEIPLLRPHGVNKKLSYDPESEGPFAAALASGQKVMARSSGEYIVLKGVLKPNRERSKAF